MTARIGKLDAQQVRALAREVLAIEAAAVGALAERVDDGFVRAVEVCLIVLALVIGLFTGLGRLSKTKVINGLASLYVEVIRGIPLLVQLFYIYYALGRIVQIPAIASAIIAMAVCYGAYMGEISRAGIESIPKGQMEAARSLGMTKSRP